MPTLRFTFNKNTDMDDFATNICEVFRDSVRRVHAYDDVEIDIKKSGDKELDEQLLALIESKDYIARQSTHLVDWF